MKPVFSLPSVRSAYVLPLELVSKFVVTLLLDAVRALDSQSTIRTHIEPTGWQTVATMSHSSSQFAFVYASFRLWYCRKRKNTRNKRSWTEAASLELWRQVQCGEQHDERTTRFSFQRNREIRKWKVVVGFQRRQLMRCIVFLTPRHFTAHEL